MRLDTYCMTTDVAGIDCRRLVLVIEGDSVVRHLLIQHLEANGCVVHATASTKDAAEKLNSNAYDLIFTESQLSDGSGDQFARAVRSHPMHKKTPIIAVSADDSAETVDALIKAGVNHFVAKPIFRVQIRAILDIIF